MIAALASSRFLSRFCCTVADVVDRLGHHPRQFLEAGETVEFERIEVGVLLIGLRDARLHLRLGLNLDLAQLPAQTNDVLGQVEQRLLQAAHFAFDSGARNRQFACLVNQAVNQLGADTQSRNAASRHRSRTREPLPARGHCASRR